MRKITCTLSGIVCGLATVGFLIASCPFLSWVMVVSGIIWAITFDYTPEKA